MKSKLFFIFFMAIIIAFFSILTLGELWIIRLLGFDLIAHLKASYEAGVGTSFYIEAFGTLAFIVGQPIIFTFLLIRMIIKVGPALKINTIMKLLIG